MRIAREDSYIGQTDPDRLADRSYIYLKLFSSPVSEVPDASLTWLLNQLCTKQSLHQPTPSSPCLPQLYISHFTLRLNNSQKCDNLRGDVISCGRNYQNICINPGFYDAGVPGVRDKGFENIFNKKD